MKIKQSLLLILFLAFIINEPHAEYRVYQFTVKSSALTALDQQSYVVTSTLDPRSYKAYHGGPSAISTDLVRSWMCYGNTAKRDVCPPPSQREMAETEVN